MKLKIKNNCFFSAGRKFLISMLAINLFLFGCASEKTYENDVFPKGEYKPINPAYFTNQEAKKIIESKE